MHTISLEGDVMNSAKQEIYDYLMDNLPFRKSGSAGKQIITICPFPDCTDKSGHMYIGPFDDSDKPLMFNCFKDSGHSGLVTPKFLEMFNLVDSDIYKTINEFNQSLPKYTSNKTSKSKIYTIYNDFITDCELSKTKLAYVNQRLGLNLGYKDMVDLKIVLNLYDLLGRNNIQYLTRHPDIVQQLNDNFVGFIGEDNNYISLRKINDVPVHPNIDKRYINYLVYKTEETCKYYMIPNAIDLTSPEPINIHMAEGAFDVLGIYFHIMNRYSYRTIYSSIGGKGYVNLIEYILTNLGLFNLNLHIYPDLDVRQDDILDLCNYMKPFNMNIFIHRNVSKNNLGVQEKDYGVPASRIIDSCIQVQKRMEYQ